MSALLKPEIRQLIVGMSKPPTPRVPVCDEALKIPLLKDRIQHYRQCADPRCVKRNEASKIIGTALAKALKR